MILIDRWEMGAPKMPMRCVEHSVALLADDEVLVRVSGCGVCHTDLGFFYEGVRTQKTPPLALGHEVSGIVEKAGSRFSDWEGQAVIIPAVLPCGQCLFCKKGRMNICPNQKMPGNHFDGGFASHVIVPAHHLCRVNVEEETALFGDSDVTLRELSVIADAVTTPYQAIKRAELSENDLAIFVGVGGVGGFGVQLAKAMGAHVVAIDVNETKLKRMAEHGADEVFNAENYSSKEIRKAISSFASKHSCPNREWRIFETSGTPQGQETAFALLTYGATLSVVGFTMDKVKVRLSNLMAFDAKAIGNWGCSPDLYPEVLSFVEKGKVKLKPFVELFPMNEINAVFEKAHQHEVQKRPIMIPNSP